MIDCGAGSGNDRNRCIVPDLYPDCLVFNFGVTHESQIWAKAEDSLWVDEDLDVPVPPYLPDTEVGPTSPEYAPREHEAKVGHEQEWMFEAPHVSA